MYSTLIRSANKGYIRFDLMALSGYYDDLGLGRVYDAENRLTVL